MELQAHKQAVFDQGGNIAGFEFFLSRFHTEEVPPDTLSGRMAFITLRTLAEYGVKKAGQGRKVFIRVPADTLLVKVFDLLEPRLMVYRLYPPSTGIGKNVQLRILDTARKLREKGALLSATPSLLSSFPELGDMVSLIEFEAEHVETSELSKFRVQGKKVLISGVNSPGLLEKVGDMADYLQGDQLQTPIAIGNFKISPYLKSTLLRLLVLLNTARTPAEFSKVIETDAGMSAKLLRFINSAFFALRQSITTVEQACIYFGLKNIRNFVLVLSINDYATVENPLLWKRALIRAKLMEEFAKELVPEKSGEAYLAGLLSLLDKMIGVDIISFLREVNVDEYVVSAFSDKKSMPARILEAVCMVEENRSEILYASDPSHIGTLSALERDLGLAPHVVVQALKNSLTMADTVINH
jgi:EAL and modified HD-GYP domain-containing signal transduction protein